MPSDDPCRCLRAAWYVPPCEKGGGGFRTILQNAQALSQRGFINDFYVVPSYGSGIDVSQMSRDCMQWFDMAPDRWFIAGSNEEARDISIATAWNTAAWADALPSKAVFYFIQDYEPWFLPLNADRLEAEQSYRKGFAHIALGRWLATRVSTFTPDVPCPYIDFGVSPIYVQREQARDSHAICAIYQPEKDRRVAPLLIEALEIALKLNPSLHVYLYGSHEQAPIASKQVTSLGIISPEECVELYNRCACGVSLSTSNPSRIPFEMMSCGLPVVDIYRPSNLYDFNDGAIRLVEPNAASLADGIVNLVSDAQLQESMRAQAHNMMQGRSLEHESNAFAHYIEEYLEKGSISTELPSVSYTNAAYTANENVIGIYKESLTAKHALLHDMNVPICCKHGGLHIEIKAEDTYEDLRVACWSQPTQSDIQWMSLSYADGSYRADVPLVESQIHKAVLHMHFYARKDAADTMIGILDVPVSFNTDSTQAEASYDAFDGHKAHLKAFDATPPLDEFHPLPTPKKAIAAWLSLLRAQGAHELNYDARTNNIALLDTALGSENTGDEIIMQACDEICEELFGAQELLRIPTHYYDARSEHLEDNIKLLCGTNILYKNMEEQIQLALPNKLASYKNICLLGVGLSDIGIDEASSRYTRLLYHTLLSSSMIHSVRDEKAKRFLNSIGINNVLNTACPTMWNLTRELQHSIPRHKASCVITSITDYCFDPELDKLMLEILRQEYERVIIWVQGSHDIDWCLNTIVNLDDFTLIGPSLSELDELLVSGEVDYVGTRLHAGIRALNHRVRSLIVAIDNRARQIGIDTQLPVIERTDIARGALKSWIHSSYECNIKLPESNIKKWKQQFIGQTA